MKETVNPFLRTGADDVERALNTGSQTYDVDKSKYPLYNPIPKLESFSQVSGTWIIILFTFAYIKTNYRLYKKVKSTKKFFVPKKVNGNGLHNNLSYFNFQFKARQSLLTTFLPDLTNLLECSFSQRCPMLH